MDGDILSLGYICDHIFFDNKAWMCSFLTSISQKSNVFGVRDLDFKQIDLKRIPNVYIKVIFKCLFDEVPYWDEFRKIFMDFKLDKLLTSLIWKNNHDIIECINSENIYDFIDDGLLNTLRQLLSKNSSVSDMWKIVSNVLSKINKKSGKKLPKELDLEHMLLKIKNFKPKKKLNPEVEEIFRRIGLNTWQQQKIIPQERYASLQKKYRFWIWDDFITVGIPELFSLIVEVIGKQDSSFSDLTKILYPLFINLPGAMQILHIARLCHKKFDKHIIMSIPSLISLGMVGMLEVSKHTKLSQKDNTVLAMIRNSQATDRKGVAKWLELVISLVSNNSNSYHNIRSKWQLFYL